MKDYPWPCELAWFCYFTAKNQAWSLDEAIQLLAWNSVKQHWSKARTMVAARLLIGAWSSVG